MAEYIEREALFDLLADTDRHGYLDGGDINSIPAADVVEVVHGHWMLEAHNERVNCRWNVTAECSECCDETKEIWAGFFPNVPDWLAKDIALQDAEQVKLSNYCPNCGAKMDGGKHV